MVKLVVREVSEKDVFHDMVRVELRHRPHCPAGSIVVVKQGGVSVPLMARGAPSRDPDSVYLDAATRQRFKVKVGQAYEFQFQKADLIDELRWSWDATSASSRIAARVGVLSLSLGIVALLLGVVSVFVALA